MTNLTDKFTALETQIADQHTAMMATLSAISGKLTWDNGEDTFSSAQLQYLALLQLQAVKDSNDSIVSYLDGISTALVDIGEDVGDIHSRLNQIRDYTLATATALGVPTEEILDVVSVLDLIKGYTQNTSNSLGVALDADDTALDHLRAIERCGCAPTGAQPPINGPCATPYASCGIAFIPWVIVGGTSVNIASWCEPLPDGLEYGTTLGLADDTTELVATAGWDGWHIFVSSAATVFGKSPLDLARYPTNTWLPLSGSDVLSVATDERNALKVYLCSPEASPAECVTLSSVEVTAPWGGTFEGISWAGSGLPCVNTGPTGTFSECIFSTNDLSEWTVITIYENVHINMSGHDSPTDFAILTPSTLTVIPGPTPYLHFYKPDGNFSISICPPSE